LRREKRGCKAAAFLASTLNKRSNFNQFHFNELVSKYPLIEEGGWNPERLGHGGEEKNPYLCWEPSSGRTSRNLSLHTQTFQGSSRLLTTSISE
jgi:hypothetical protein